MNNEESSLSVEERLSDLSFDLILYWDIFLEELFSIEAGLLTLVRSLTKSIEKIQRQLDEFDEELIDNYLVAWLRFPEHPEGEDFCIIFFCADSDDVAITDRALYNRGYFFSKRDDDMGRGNSTE